MDAPMPVQPRTLSAAPPENVILSVAAGHKRRLPHSLAATEGPVAAAAPSFAACKDDPLTKGRYGHLAPSADSRSFGRRRAFVRVWITAAAALRMTFLWFAALCWTRGAHGRAPVV